MPVDDTENAGTRPAQDWSEGYFERTAGAFVGEDFERPPQGELPSRDDW